MPVGQLLAPFMDRKLGAIDFLATEMRLGSANPRQADFRVVLANNAQNIHNLVRGTYPWPGAYFMHAEKKISLLETSVIPNETTGSFQWVNLVVHNGLLRYARNDDALIVQCYDSSLLRILKVKPEGKNEMAARAWFNGLACK